MVSPAWNAWDAARTELLALSTFLTDGVLESIAWPQGAGSAHFDGVVQDTAGTGGLVAIDVKSGQGAGLSLLEALLAPTANRWAQQHSFGDVDLEISCRGGALTQELLQTQVGRLRREFLDALNPQVTMQNAQVELRLNGMTILVNVLPGADLRVHSQVVDLANRQASIGRVMADHEAHKGKHAQGDQRPFVLVYVSPSGAGGTDVRAAELRDAAKQLAQTASAWWLGTVHLDWTNGKLRRTGFLRQDGGNWPSGSTQATLSKSLGL